MSDFQGSSKRARPNGEHPRVCSVDVRILNDRAHGISTSTEARAFVRHTCPCENEKCKSLREIKARVDAVDDGF